MPKKRKEKVNAPFPAPRDKVQLTHHMRNLKLRYSMMRRNAVLQRRYGLHVAICRQRPRSGARPRA